MLYDRVQMETHDMAKFTCTIPASVGTEEAERSYMLGKGGPPTGLWPNHLVHLCRYFAQTSISACRRRSTRVVIIAVPVLLR